MKRQKIRILILALFFSVIAVFCQAPAYAQLWVLNEQMTIRQNDNVITINRNLNSTERHVDEFIRGRDLSRAVRELTRKIKDMMAILKGRRLDQIRATEISRIAESNAKDIMRRNKMIQQIQNSSQRGLIQDLKMKNRDLNQRIRDLSRR